MFKRIEEAVGFENAVNADEAKTLQDDRAFKEVTALLDEAEPSGR
jgi:hypothetical protein